MDEPAFRLEEMTAHEFEEYMEASISSYAKEGARATGMEADAALEFARGQFADLLPDGRHTEGQFIRRIMDPDDGRIGVIWYAQQLEESPPCLFVYEIAISDSHRGRGLGSSVMLHLENLCRNAGAARIMLHVFTHNEGAIRLYRRLGYSVDAEGPGGLRMVKEVT